MHRKFDVGVILAIFSGIVYGLASVAFKQGIEIANYSSLLTDKGLWMAVVVFALVWLSLFTRFKSSHILKIAFIISIVYIVLFMVFKISFFAVVLLVVAFLLAFFALSYIDASIAWPLTGCKYVVCSLIAYLLLNESLTIINISGIAMILLGSVFLVQGAESVVKSLK
ncbi:MAG: hypothetical protein EF807_03760 [Candidatus Methanolliviera hydrocarbonicum]|uniref:EamA domain-containing protein n=1 Tax=Candidatus Methanolliviera hydrocarbonicum TaxID=2491085 RepID=A0A520KX36_9EURY|nr:MAG: hypothetical protein EF807_03760 [Candidatus Methanolliviera hydrocarbonicum]